MPFPFKLPQRYVYEGPTLEGGQGAVYVCIDKYLDRKVAIKVMNGVSNSNEIQKELSAIQAVRSRHVAQIYDLVTSQNGKSVGLVEEYVPGPTVSEYAARGQITADYLKILYQIACGISDIHESGRIHRDIKPSNIKLDSEHVIKILDFGLTSDTATDAITVDARGTPCYIAPELYATPPVRYTAAVDTFAFGITARVLAEGGAVLPSFRQTPPYSNPFPGFSTNPIQLAPDLVALFDHSIMSAPGSRPKMSEIRDCLQRHLVYGQHRAVITYSGKGHELSTIGKSINLKVGVDVLTINYDGLAFRIESVSGNVYINNAAALQGAILPDSCVITLGEAALGGARTFVPFNVSHPGVVL
ncbi:MAG TPA: serine/threonine-protein kinase [Candidatus Angelobacter sp.]|jgi:serine/threonine-protein kinase